MYDFLVMLAEISEFLPLIFLILFKTISLTEKTMPLIDFVIIKIVALFMSSVVVFLNKWDMSLNSMIQNSYAIIYFFVISQLYRKILDRDSQQFLTLGNVLFLLILTFSLFKYNFRIDFLNYLVAGINLIFSLYGIVFILTTNPIEFSGDFKKYFFLNIAFLTYNSCMFPAMCFDRIIINDMFMIPQKLLWSIILISTLNLNTFLSIFLLKNSLFEKYFNRIS